MLKNCVNKLPRKTQTAMQDSATENCTRKKTRPTMWALRNSLTIRFFPSNPQNNWLPQQTKTLRSKVRFPRHERSVTVSDDVSWLYKIGISLHQCDNYISQVKINATTVNNSCFLPYSRLASFSSFSRTVPGKLSTWAFLPVTSPNADWS